MACLAPGQPRACVFCASECEFVRALWAVHDDLAHSEEVCGTRGARGASGGTLGDRGRSRDGETTSVRALSGTRACGPRGAGAGRSSTLGRQVRPVWARGWRGSRGNATLADLGTRARELWTVFAGSTVQSSELWKSFGKSFGSELWKPSRDSPSEKLSNTTHGDATRGVRIGKKLGRITFDPDGSASMLDAVSASKYLIIE